MQVHYFMVLTIPLLNICPLSDIIIFRLMILAGLPATIHGT